MKKFGPDGTRRRTLLGATMIVVVAVVAVIVGILVGVKGIGPALPAVFGGTTFVVILMLYWFHSEKDDATAGGRDE